MYVPLSLYSWQPISFITSNPWCKKLVLYTKCQNDINGRGFLGQHWPWRICLYLYMIHVKVDLECWPCHVTPKHVWLNEMHVHAKYDVYVATMTYFKLTLKDELELDMSPLYVCVSFWNTCMQNMKLLIGCVKFVYFEFNWFLPLRDDFDLDKSPTQNMHFHEIDVQAKYEVSICNGTKVISFMDLVHDSCVARWSNW